MKKKNSFVCNECHYESPKWLGKCTECGTWNSLVELNINENLGDLRNKSLKSKGLKPPRKLSDIDEESIIRFITGINEFDRVMGGGVAPNSLTLVGGEPGIGKSTLLLEAINRLAEKYSEEKILYISGEESESQLFLRAKRLGISSENILILNETIWQNILITVDEYKPKFLVIDSIQTTISADIQSLPGSVSQIREVTFELMNHIKSKNITCFVVGHINKDGGIAGPKVLEHMVDGVIYFEGDQYGQYRTLRSIKNRFGDTNEVGLFEMKKNGLNEVSNPSLYFLDSRYNNSFGRSLTCIMEGTRPLFIEIQTLVIENKLGTLRRVTQGIDSNRLAMIVAIVEKYFEISLAYNDIYLNVVGGFKLTTRESDLSIVASLISSYKKCALPSDSILIGEIGLTGEICSVPMIENRLKEVQQMNYKKVFTSQKIASLYKNSYKELEIIGVRKVSKIYDYLFQ